METFFVGLLRFFLRFLTLSPFSLLPFSFAHAAKRGNVEPQVCRAALRPCSRDHLLSNFNASIILRDRRSCGNAVTARVVVSFPPRGNSHRPSIRVYAKLFFVAFLCCRRRSISSESGSREDFERVNLSVGLINKASSSAHGKSDKALVRARAREFNKLRRSVVTRLAR